VKQQVRDGDLKFLGRRVADRHFKRRLPTDCLYLHLRFDANEKPVILIELAEDTLFVAVENIQPSPDTEVIRPIIGHFKSYQAVIVLSICEPIQAQFE
jgi:hypothetical protein